MDLIKLGISDSATCGAKADSVCSDRVSLGARNKDSSFGSAMQIAKLTSVKSKQVVKVIFL